MNTDKNRRADARGERRFKQLIGWADDLLYRCWRWVKVAWLIAKHRPLLRCPFCEGDGGHYSSTECGREWCECFECYEHWRTLEDARMDWFVGRGPLWSWVRGRFALACGLWESRRIRDLIRCKIGWHHWIDESQIEPGLEICCVCWSGRRNGKMLKDKSDGHD